MSAPTYQRRQQSGPEPEPNNRESDADYFGNLEKFKRTDDMAAPPTRSGY